MVSAVRSRVSAGFSVSVKLNSADFLRGGFSEDDAKQVVLLLNELPVDLIELSGGSYESPAMQGRTADGRTLAREAYFLEFAKDLAGIATALAEVPDLPLQWRDGREPAALPPAVEWKDKTMASVAAMGLVKRRLRALGDGASKRRRYSPLWTVILGQLRTASLTRRYRAWRVTAAG
ncbi:hypothetical protein RugamoR1_13970 [Rugamonas sp. R1(2021)]